MTGTCKLWYNEAFWGAHASVLFFDVRCLAMTASSSLPDSSSCWHHKDRYLRYPKASRGDTRLCLVCSAPPGDAIVIHALRF